MSPTTTSAVPTPVNRLGRETSPYLLQHKDNPVHWWAWGPEALAEARHTGKPILLSVGYAACHWCHVMAHESFEDDATAKLMNELFVNIKVDREERPDIDQIYMNALHLLGEQGGWPLTMFLTPRAEPVWGGTYFPKQSHYGRPAFGDVLREVSRLFRRLMMEKLLIGPTEQLKTLSDAETTTRYTEVINRLFSLSPPGSSEPAPDDDLAPSCATAETGPKRPRTSRGKTSSSS